MGDFINLSEKGAQLRRRLASCQQTSPYSLELLSNLKLKLLIEAEMATEEHIYAKAIEQSHVDEHLFLLRFTAVPPKADAILNALRQPG